MLFLKKRHPKNLPVFGLDIESECVRCVFFDPRHPRQRLLRAATHITLPGTAIESGIIRTPDAVVAALKELLMQNKKLRLPPSASVGLPDEQCYVLTVMLARSDTRAIGEAIRWEIAQHVPFGIEELYVDWSEVSANGERSIYQVAAAPKTLVDPLIAVLDEVGILPVALEVSSLALLRMLRIPPGNTIVLSTGQSSTTLSLLTSQGIPLSLNSSVFSGRTLTSILTKQLQLDAHEAEMAKSIFGFDPTENQGVVRQALLPELKMLINLIQRALDFLATLEPTAPCRDLVLAGSQSNIRSLSEELRLKTHLHVHVQPYHRLTIPEHHHRALLAERELADYAICCGLALPHQ
ncbi:MAG: pilus assembly protein PilM [bacterium]